MIVKTFNPETNILEVIFKGESDVTEILIYHQEIKNDKTLPRNLKILYDTTNSNSNSSNIILFSDGFKDILNKYTFIRSAFVLNSIYLDTFTKLYKNLMGNVTNYECELFKTRVEALEYLLKL